MPLLKTQCRGLGRAFPESVTSPSIERLPKEMVLPFPPHSVGDRRHRLQPEIRTTYWKGQRDKKTKVTATILIIKGYKTKKVYLHGKNMAKYQAALSHHSILHCPERESLTPVPFSDMRWHRIGYCKKLTLPWPKLAHTSTSRQQSSSLAGHGFNAVNPGGWWKEMSLNWTANASCGASHTFSSLNCEPPFLTSSPSSQFVYLLLKGPSNTWIISFNLTVSYLNWWFPLWINRRTHVEEWDHQRQGQCLSTPKSSCFSKEDPVSLAVVKRWR